MFRGRHPVPKSPALLVLVLLLFKFPDVVVSRLKQRRLPSLVLLPSYQRPLLGPTSVCICILGTEAQSRLKAMTLVQILSTGGSLKHRTILHD